MLTILAATLLAKPLVMAHYMPWYQNKEVTGKWGWHWTMNHFDPDRVVGSRPDAASQYRPLIGLYDSSDPAVLEYQCLLMRESGIDGLLIDWYGVEDANDYLALHKNTLGIIQAAKKVGLKFGIVFEDRTIGEVVKARKLSRQDATDVGRSTIKWLGSNWFQDPAYLKIDNKPALLVFGPVYYHDSEWSSILASSTSDPAFYTLLGRRGSAVGGYGWPEPQVGDAKSWSQLRNFYERAKDWPSKIAIAYPRFEDIYSQAGVGANLGEIKDQAGKTFLDTMSMAIGSGAPVIQIATWNDWGEGTQIEPSVEYGYRDLEALQRIQSVKAYSAQDLRLPPTAYTEETFGF